MAQDSSRRSTAAQFFMGGEGEGGTRSSHSRVSSSYQYIILGTFSSI